MVRLAAFISGAALLILELLGVRMLTPTFGSSVMIYSAVIAVFLAAMAVGYFVGGYFADRAPSTRTLAGVFCAASLLVAASTVIARPVASFIGQARWGGLWAPMLAAFVIFALPSAVLAFVPPLAIRLEMRDVARSGSVSGRLYAISTAGSIAGTLSVPLLMTLMPVSWNLYSIAAVLMVLSAVLFVVSWSER